MVFKDTSLKIPTPFARALHYGSVAAQNPIFRHFFPVIRAILIDAQTPTDNKITWEYPKYSLYLRFPLDAPLPRISKQVLLLRRAVYRTANRAATPTAASLGDVPREGARVTKIAYVC